MLNKPPLSFRKISGTPRPHGFEQYGKKSLNLLEQNVTGMLDDDRDVAASSTSHGAIKLRGHSSSLEKASPEHI
jgi:hypothetical protein